MTDQLELDWLNEERPQPLPLDPATTSRVRAQLLSGEGTMRSRRPVRRRVRSRSMRFALPGIAVAACAAAVVLATSGGSTGSGPGLTPTVHSPTVHSPAVQSASAKQLNHLSMRLAADTAPIGDATLVLRTQTYPSGSPITGADLYADNGNYYYATSLSGLPAAIAANETVNTDASDSEVRDIAAAKAALTGPIDAARKQMSIANLDPGVQPKLLGPNSANDADLPAAQRKKFAEIKANAEAQDIQPEMSQEDSSIWDNSMDALTAGAGDPQVRAGVLKLLATVPQIQVTQGTLNGQPTLILSAKLLSSKSGIYQEQLILNANTGVPVQFIGGNIGQTPGVTIGYTINRVTVASIENGNYTG